MILPNLGLEITYWPNYYHLLVVLVDDTLPIGLEIIY